MIRKTHLSTRDDSAKQNENQTKYRYHLTKYGKEKCVDSMHLTFGKLKTWK